MASLRDVGGAGDRSVEPFLTARGLVRRFPGVLALDRVDLSIDAGEVLAVIGENGAGKSTLMKILAGVQRPDAGQIRVAGVPVEIGSVRDAEALGISFIHQELNLCENLDVAANIFLGREPGRRGFIDSKALHARADELLRQVGLDCSSRTIVGSLSIGHRQLVEIAKALSMQTRMLIMDEPTSSLSPHEAEQLFRVIADLRRRGVCVVYISHRLAEVQAVADRVVVLRDGKNSGMLGRDEIDHDRMVELMVGRDLSGLYEREPHDPGEVLLEAVGLRTAANPDHALSFELRAGEVVGLTGLVGAGRTELLRALFGVERAVGGTLRVGGKTVTFRHPQDAIRAGVALVPEDRKEHGVFLEMAVRQNIGLTSLARDACAGLFLDFDAECRTAGEMVEALNIRASSDLQPVQFLSGGNQQKVVLAKWFALGPRVLLLDEPTRGVDVGARHEIYRLMEEIAAGGVAILFASSDLQETIGMSDRALVMHEGRISGELARADLNEEAVMRLATDRDRQPAA